MGTNHYTSRMAHQRTAETQRRAVFNLATNGPNLEKGSTGNVHRRRTPEPLYESPGGIRATEILVHAGKDAREREARVRAQRAIPRQSLWTDPEKYGADARRVPRHECGNSQGSSGEESRTGAPESHDSRTRAAMPSHQPSLLCPRVVDEARVSSQRRLAEHRACARSSSGPHFCVPQE